MSWSQRINLVIEYIERNLNGAITTEDAAKIACCSKYHFHRVFFSYFRVTFAEYIRARKFTLAAVDVVNGEERILDIALKYGYESPNAFTRAFRNIHGVNPNEARLTQVKLATYSRVSFPIKERGIEKMDYKIIERPSFNVVGKSKSFDFDEFYKNGKQFWKEYVSTDEYKALCQLTNGKPGPVTVAPLLTAYFPKEKSKLDEFIDVLGLEVTSDIQTEAFEVHTVPPATYAEFDCSYRSAMKTNRYIYSEWFSATGYERDGDKPDVVAYFPMPYRHFSEMGVRWWVPIIKES